MTNNSYEPLGPLTDHTLASSEPSRAVKEANDLAIMQSIYEKLAAVCDKKGVNTLEIGNWDGGNDSGSERLNEEAYDDVLSPDETHWLESEIDHTLGYGSYAGGFATSGTYVFDKTQRCIFLNGTDVNYEETDATLIGNRDIELSEALAAAIIDLVIPERVPTDPDAAASLYSDEETFELRPNVCDFVLKNGVTPDDYPLALESLRSFIVDCIQEAESAGDVFAGFNDGGLHREDGIPPFYRIEGYREDYDRTDVGHEVPLNWDDNWSCPETAAEPQ